MLEEPVKQRHQVAVAHRGPRLLSVLAGHGLNVLRLEAPKAGPCEQVSGHGEQVLVHVQVQGQGRQQGHEVYQQATARGALVQAAGTDTGLRPQSER